MFYAQSTGTVVSGRFALKNFFKNNESIPTYNNTIFWRGWGGGGGGGRQTRKEVLRFVLRFNWDN